MYSLEIRHKFDAAHQLKDNAGLITKACANLHGHTYAVRVFVESSKTDYISGMVVDFKAIKNIIDVLDHQYINDIFQAHPVFYTFQPTAENIALYLYCETQKYFEDVFPEGRQPRVTKVMVCEGYKGEEFSSWAIFEPTICTHDKE